MHWSAKKLRSFHQSDSLGHTKGLVATNLYRGQGLGNQMWAYAVCRSIASDLGFDFSVRGYHRFKGKHLFDLDFGLRVGGSVPRVPSQTLPPRIETRRVENKVFHPTTRQDITPYDPQIGLGAGSFLLEGNFESDLYFRDRRAEVQKWFSSELTVPGEDDVCVVSFRGGEMANVPGVFLPPAFYDFAMDYLLQKNPALRFEVVTDDPQLAKNFFSEIPIVSKRLLSAKWASKLNLIRVRSHRRLAHDFSRLQGARYLIIPNSSFSWWGAYSNVFAKEVVAPRGWWAYNTNDGISSPGSIQNPFWTWIDKEGRVFPASH